MFYKRLQLLRHADAIKHLGAQNKASLKSQRSSQEKLLQIYDITFKG